MLCKFLSDCDTAPQVGHIEQMFADQRTLLFIASACKKPSDAEFGELLRPLQADIEGVSKAKETYRKDRDWASHLTFVAEGAPVAGWVTIVRYSTCLATSQE
jgi:adenylyl cyclase-associated protein